MLVDASAELFFSKKDPADPRLGDVVKKDSKIENAGKNSAYVVGYPDDEGIKLNGGRTGAAKGPDSVRQYLYKMTPSLRSENPAIFDGGNLKIEGSLDDRHASARKIATSILKAGSKLATIGGGHDYGFPDFAAFCDAAKAEGKRPFILNFDAHLDVRPDDKGPHSGTPFFRLLNEFKGHVDFFEIGIQDWCNSRAHYDWAVSRGTGVITLDELWASGENLDECLEKKIVGRATKEHMLAVSIDIDGFSSAFAPGASQVFPSGIDANEFMKFWKPFLARLKPRLVSVYEVSPPFDQDGRTARLAATLIHSFLYS